MCLACALPVIHGDWTSAGVSPPGTLAVPGIDPVIDALSNLLGRHGLQVGRGGKARGFLITGPSGRVARAATVDDIWPAAEALTGRCLDPLDPQFLGPA